MLFLRSLLFQIVYYTNLGFWMLLWLPALVMPRRATLELGRQWGRTSLWWLEVICGLKHEFRGMENIPKGQIIVACKHQSVWETFVLPILFPRLFLHFEARAGLLFRFLAGIFCRRSKSPSTAPRAASAAAARAQVQGHFRARAGSSDLSRGHAPPPPRAARYSRRRANLSRDEYAGRSGGPELRPILGATGLLRPPGKVVISFCRSSNPALAGANFHRVADAHGNRDRPADRRSRRGPSLAPIVAANRKLPPKSARRVQSLAKRGKVKARLSTFGANPRARLLRFRSWKQFTAAGDRKPKRFHRLLDPFDVGDDRDALPAREMLHSDLEILPHGAEYIPKKSAAVS